MRRLTRVGALNRVSRNSRNVRRSTIIVTLIVLCIVLPIWLRAPSHDCPHNEFLHRDALSSIDEASNAASNRACHEVRGSRVSAVSLRANSTTRLRCGQSHGAPSPSVRIPRVVVQTGFDMCVPEGMYGGTRAILEQSTASGVAFAFDFFTDDMMREYMEAYCGLEFDGGLLIDAFDMLVPGAFRADLFRYCYLYTMGGVYLDLGMNPPSLHWNQRDVVSLDSLLQRAESTGIALIVAEDNNLGFAYNGAMAASPCHPVLKIAMVEAAKRVHARFYTTEDYGALLITGPQLLRDALLNYFWDVAIDIQAVESRGYTSLTITAGRVKDVLVLSYRRLLHCLSGILELNLVTLQPPPGDIAKLKPRAVRLLADGTTTAIPLHRRLLFQLDRLLMFIGGRLTSAGEGQLTVLLFTKTTNYYHESRKYFGQEHYGVIWSRGPRHVYRSADVA